MSPGLFTIFFALTGVMVGSFLNVIIHRGPVHWGIIENPHNFTDKNNTHRLFFFSGRSQCPHCHHKIRIYDLVPIVSYTFLKGKCRDCGTAIPPFYPCIELFMMLAAIFIALGVGVTIQAVWLLIFISFLCCLSVIDWRTGYLPDTLTLPLVWLGLLANLHGQFASLPDAVAGAIAGYSSLRIIEYVYQKLRAQEGLGRGDAKLFAALGAWLGIWVLPLVLLVAALSGLAYVACCALCGMPVSKKTAIAFGPFLALGGTIALCIHGKVFLFHGVGM